LRTSPPSNKHAPLSHTARCAALALKDDLHVARERAEHLEARLRRTATEEAAQRAADALRERERSAKAGREAAAAAAARADAERQLAASAAAAAALEEQCVVAKAAAAAVSDKLAREQERREGVCAELERVKATALEVLMQRRQSNYTALLLCLYCAQCT
jgi:hypothetical protein